MTELVKLIERVEAATGPDRDLDHWLSSYSIAGAGNDGFGAYRDRASWVAASIEQRWNAAYYTASIDAALGLVERVLPGAWWSVKSADGSIIGSVHQPAADPTEDASGLAKAETPPLAILLALLRALSARSP